MLLLVLVHSLAVGQQQAPAAGSVCLKSPMTGNVCCGERHARGSCNSCCYILLLLPHITAAAAAYCCCCRCPGVHLSFQVRLPVDTRRADDPHVKAHLLLQVIRLLPDCCQTAFSLFSGCFSPAAQAWQQMRLLCAVLDAACTASDATLLVIAYSQCLGCLGYLATCQPQHSRNNSQINC